MIKEYDSFYDYNEYLYLDTTKDFQKKVEYIYQDTKDSLLKNEYSFSSDDWQASIWFNNIFKLRDNVATLDFSNFNGIIKDFDLDKIYEYCLSQNIDERTFKLSKLHIDSCVKYSNKVGKSIQVTIADENKASYNAFYSYFKNKGKEFKKIDQIKVTDLNDESFLEEENRYEVSFN